MRVSEAASLGVSVFPGMVKDAPTEPVAWTNLRVLKPAESNVKLGKRHNVWIKGPWKGMPLYSLSLEERATCPTTCQAWVKCYGSNMRYAIRYNPGPELEEAIRADLGVLDTKHVGGYTIRLHVLGDFYSVEYVKFWWLMLARHPGLRIYGYTHRKSDDLIGQCLRMVQLWASFQAPMGTAPRFAMMASDGEVGDTLPRAVVIPTPLDVPKGMVWCPEQSGRTASCLTCGLCTNRRTEVAFVDHAWLTKQKREGRHA